MNRRTLFLLLFLVGSAGTAFSASYYVNERFTNMSTLLAHGWVTNFFYGRDGILRVPDTGADYCGAFPDDVQTNTRIWITNRRIVFQGTPNRDDQTLQSIWVGRMLKYNAKEFTASSTQPFGFEVIRTSAWIDPYLGCYGTYTWRQQCEGSVWMVQENDITANFAQFNYFTCFYDYCQPINEPLPVSPANYDASRSKWGYFFGTMNDFDLGKARRPDGRKINLTNSAIFSLYWNYEDDHAPAGTANTNAIGIRITHDGSYLRYYLNPNPRNRAIAYPNEYCFVGSNIVSWNTRLKMMMGSENIRHDQEKANVSYSNVLVRSVASMMKVQMVPEGVSPDGSEGFKCVLSPEFNDTDSGIGEVILTKNCAAGWIPDSVVVRADTDSDGVEEVLPVDSGVGSVLPGKVRVTVSGDSMKIRFCKLSEVQNDVMRFGRAGRTMKISFALHSDRVGDIPSNAFTVHADSQLYEGESFPFYATTGAMKAVMLEDHVSLKNNNVKDRE